MYPRGVQVIQVESRNTFGPEQVCLAGLIFIEPAIHY